MNQTELLYRTVDGQADYRFRFEEHNNGRWKVYILYHPPYGNANQSLHATHRLYDSKGTFISWDPLPETIEEAKNVAAMWAEFTQNHIKNEKEKDMSTKKDTTKVKSQKIPVLKMTLQVLSQVISTIGCRKSESGGVIGRKDDTVFHYQFDKNGSTSPITYSPDIETVNEKLTRWNELLIRMAGFVHSHPGKNNRPSHGDLVYAKRILEHIDDMEELWLPIINTVPDTGKFTLTPWVVKRANDGVELVRGKIEFDASGVPFRPPAADFMSLLNLVPIGEQIDVVEIDADEIDWLKEDKKPLKIFDRVNEAYDLERMKNTLIVAVGAGGSAEWAEQVARCGLGYIVLIDPDTVSETNIGTQQTYLKDVGRPKVDCIAERLREINPDIEVLKFQTRLEEISPKQVEEIVGGALFERKPTQTILCGLTDNFYAQAQVNRIALNFGVPSICAQIYMEGRGAEITFTYPGVTSSCHRCMLSPRYKHYLEHGGKNDVTSHGTPIFATAMLNAIKGYITLAMIHHGSDHKRWGNTLSRIGDRSLVQIRLDSEIANTLGMPTFDKVFDGADAKQLFFGEPVWISQEPECPETGYPHHCPDCGGTGDLRDAKGTIKDMQLPAAAKTRETAAIKGTA